MRATLLALAFALAVAPLAACAFAVDNAGTVCGGNICPTGWSCIAGETCVAPDGDASPSADARLDGDGAPIVIDGGPVADANPAAPDAAPTLLLGCGNGQVRAGIEACDPPSISCTPLCQRCTGGIVLASGECVSLGAESDWLSAITKCGVTGRGATLASTDEVQAVAAAFGRDVWVYGDTVGVSATPRWLTNEAFNLLVGLSDDAPCLAATAAGQVVARSCETILPALCENGTPIVQSNGRAFRVVYPPVTSDAAAARCVELGAQLANPNVVDWSYAREGGRMWVTPDLGACRLIDVTPGLGVTSVSELCGRTYPVLCEFP